MTQGTLNLKRKVTQTVSARQLVRAEMATKGARHALAVTLDTHFHDKEGIKLISTYPETHSIDSAYIYILQVINLL